MNNEQIQKIQQIAIETFNEQSGLSRFNMRAIPFHVHNGQDSPQIPAQFLNFSNFATWGQVMLVSGTANIVNQNIQGTSVIVATGVNNTVTAVCGAGYATISGINPGDTVNYLIIF